MIRGAVAIALLVAAIPGAARAQRPTPDLRVSLVYTGRSLGALGVLRAQDEHELITEQANAEHLSFKLVSHACWRAPGITIFLPTDEPEGDELPALLAARPTAERIDSVMALRSNNVLLVQDPRRPDPDLLALLNRNPRRASSFPDLVPTRVTMYRLRAPRGERALVVQEAGAVWPEDPSVWTLGEMNRINIGEARLFEMPTNLGQIGPRATVVAKVLAEARAVSGASLLADLGERDGDLGLERSERARIDYTALTHMGYSLSVPYEFELALGAAGLDSLRARFPGIRFMAANVKAKDSTLFERSRLVEVNGVKIGLLGLVDPTIRGELPRQVLDDFTIGVPLDAARREVRALRLAGAEAVVALSNLEPADNAVIASEVAGIDAIVADLHVRWSPEAVRTEVNLPDRPRSRPGSPALVARGFANGLGVGRLDLVFRTRAEDGGRYLASVSHVLESVTDRTPADTALANEVRAMAQVAKRPRGELLIPAFVDMAQRHPALRDFDETTQQGRVSKRMWEEFVARLLRNGGRAEVAIIRQFPYFPPLIGKLHEDEVRSWLWTEDHVVLLDLKGAEIRTVVESDTRRDLVLSGIDRNTLKVMGRELDDEAFYRVATTDVIFEGSRASEFAEARRIRRALRVDEHGGVAGAPHGQTLPLRDFVLAQLRGLRDQGKGEAQLDRIAGLLAPDPPYENLLVFAFDRPTLWGSLNRSSGTEGYGNVPESRVTSNDAVVFGAEGNFKVTYDRQRFASDVGLSLAFAQQSATDETGVKQISQTADDIQLGLTLRRKGLTPGRLQPFLRGLFDTEFTPTTNPTTGVANPHQLALRGVLGIMRPPDFKWRVLEAAAVVLNDFGQPHVQYGLQARSDTRFPLGKDGRVIYALSNDATWLLPSNKDTESDLALRYNMVHELLIPLVDELSLAVAADFFFFKGKVESTSKPGSSMIFRVGITYDRLWKPRYQPLF